MPEVPHASEHHRQAQPVRRRDHVRVAHRSAWLNHRGDPVFRRFLHAVCERERTRRMPSRIPSSGRTAFIAADLHRIHAAHLPRAHAHRLPGARIDDRVRLHVLRQPSSRTRARSILPRSGARCVFTCVSARDRRCVSAVCARYPPVIDFTTRSFGGARDLAAAADSSSRRASRSAAGEYAGAAMASTNVLAISRGGLFVHGAIECRARRRMPRPGRLRSALRYAFGQRRPLRRSRRDWCA